VSRFASLLGLALLAGLFLPLSVAPAEAAFSVCNKTSHGASVAIGYFDGNNWDSAGWWKIPGSTCTQLIPAPLVARYYYLYAEHDIGGAWDGDRSFCIKHGRFTIKRRKDCLAQGFEARRFFQVDTGSSTDWTENLAD
jgi:uncharacterized membrane protein